MATSFFGGAFFDGEFFFGSAAVPTVISGGVRRKKLRILPDGRRLFLSEQDAIDTLLLYYQEQKLKPKEAAVLGLEPNRKKKVIILPSERLEILEALETLDVERKLRMRAEEEWLILFH